LVISVLIATALAVQTLALPQLKRDESYARARKSLLRAGWRPVETFGRFADGTLVKEFGDAGEILRAGFKEIYDCTGTGLNYCTFVWKRGNRCGACDHAR
jgi:hypothetical protein